MLDQDPADRILREALGDDWGRDPDDVTSMAEVEALIRDLPIERPIKPLPEDVAKVPPLPRNATQAEQAHAYRLAQANAMLRIARAEKRRRREAG